MRTETADDFEEGGRMEEEKLRKAAIRRYVLSGERPKQIYGSLNRSKKWFFKWLKRYNTMGLDWNKDIKKKNDLAKSFMKTG